MTGQVVTEQATDMWRQPHNTAPVKTYDRWYNTTRRCGHDFLRPPDQRRTRPVTWLVRQTPMIENQLESFATAGRKSVSAKSLPL